MKLAWVASGAAFVAAVAIAVSWPRGSGGEAESRSAESAPVVSDSSAELDDAQRSAVEPEPDGRVVRHFDGPVVRGRVVAVDGSPVAGVFVQQLVGRRPVSIAQTDEEGKFEGAVESETGSLTLLPERWVCIAPCPLVSGMERDAVVLLAAQRGRVSGKVLDARNLPVATAQVFIRLSEELKATLPRASAPPPNVLATGRTEIDGTFRFDRVAAVPNARVLAAIDPLQGAGVTLASGSADNVLIVLRDPEDASVFEGVVVNRALQPLSGATIQLGPLHSSPTAVDGRFRVALPRGGLEKLRDDAALVARHVDYESYVERGFGARVKSFVPDPQATTLMLPGPALSLRGRVVDPDGTDVPCEFVQLVDPTPLPQSADLTATLEDAETFLQGQSEFRFDGVCDRPYHLRITLQGSLFPLEAGPLRPSNEVQLVRVSRDPGLVTLRVHLIDDNGTDVSGARVWAQYDRTPHDARVRFWGANDPVTNDAGAVELDVAAGQSAWIHAAHPDRMPASTHIESLAQGSIELVARHRTFLVLERATRDLDRVTAVLLDGDGRPVRLMKPDDLGTSIAESNDRFMVAMDQDGRGLIVGPTGSYELVVTEGERVLLRQSVELVAEDWTVVRF